MVLSAAGSSMSARSNLQTGEGSFASVIIISLSFHLIVFVGIPVLTRLFYHEEKFERPKTFSLVRMPMQNLAQPVIQPKQAQRKPKAATTPVPARKKAKSAAKSEAKPEEKNDELNELLDAIPVSVSDITPGQSFKYAWYLNSVISKVEEKWKPPMGLTDRKDAASTVIFTILSSGEISGVSIAGSSGISTLDNLAVKAVQTAAPFGKLPVGFQGDRLDIKYVLHYIKQ